MDTEMNKNTYPQEGVKVQMLGIRNGGSYAHPKMLGGCSSTHIT